MKLKYLIPIIGFLFIYNDIPLEEWQRSFKPLQGDEAFFAIVAQAIIAVLTLFLIPLIWQP